MSHSSGRPRSIIGSDGTRVKLLFGATGEDYILLLDEDDGKREWQSAQWSGDVPSKLCKQINNCYAKNRHVTQMAFGSTGQWYVSGCKRSADRTLYGGHCWWGRISDDSDIKDFCDTTFRLSFGCGGSYVGLKGSNGHIICAVPEGLKTRMKKAHQKSEKIKVARIFQHSEDAYFVSDDTGTEWCGLGSQLGKHIKNGGKDEILDVICAADGSWVVLRPNRFVASNGVSSKVCDRLDEFFQQQKSRRKATNRRIRAYDAELLQRQQEAEAEAARQALAEQQRQAEARRRREEAIEAARQAEQERWVEERWETDVAGLEHQTKRAREKAERRILKKRRKVEVQSVVQQKGLREGSVVAMAELGEAGSAVVTMLRSDGVEIRLREGRGKTVLVRDPRQLVVMDRGPHDDRSEVFAMLCVAVDKYEASLCFLTSCKCSHGVCKCKLALAATVKVGHSSSHIRPLLEKRNSVQRFDEYVCAEKIDLVRLRRVTRQLRSDHAAREQRTAKLKAQLQRGLSGDREARAHEWLKALQRCHKIEMVANELERSLADIPEDNDGCVVHEVRYEHRDTSARGRLFTIGTEVKVAGEEHPRSTTLQGMPSDLRRPLVGAFAHDIDCENSEVRLVCSLATQLDLLHLIPTLADYRDRRAHWLGQIASIHGVSEKTAKRLPNIILSGGRYDTWLKLVGQPKGTQPREIRKFAWKLGTERRALLDQLLLHPRFRWTEVEQKQMVALGRHPNEARALLMPRIVQNCENEVLSIIHRQFHSLGWRVRAKVFDGLIVEPPTFTSDRQESITKAIADTEAACRARGWDVRLVEKQLYGTHDTTMPAVDEARRAMRRERLSSGPRKRPQRVAFLAVPRELYKGDAFYGGHDKYKLNTQEWHEGCDILDEIPIQVLDGIPTPVLDPAVYATVVTVESFFDSKGACRALKTYYEAGGRVVVFPEVGVFAFVDETLSSLFGVNWKMISYGRMEFELTTAGAAIVGGRPGDRIKYTKAHCLKAPEGEAVVLPHFDAEFHESEYGMLPLEPPCDAPVAFHAAPHGGQLAFMGFINLFCDEKISTITEKLIRRSLGTL